MSGPDKYLVALSTYLPFGPARLSLLTNYFGSAGGVWAADKSELLETGLSAKLVDGFVKHRRNFSSKEFFANLKEKGITFTTIGDESYPENLVGIVGAPTTLYIRGRLTKNDVNAIAVVGSRKITSYGRQVTEKFAVELAQYGVTIVSGLAFGVDRYAHESALSVGGRCIAVLASGVDDITPRSNEWLGKKIIQSGGAVISEFPPGTKVQKSYFPQRNRIISGLAKAILVVEGAEKSGTLHTARHAADQGKEVFAVPGQVTSPLSAAPHYLIKNGAKVAFSAKDIIEELDMQLKVDRQAMGEILPATKEEAKLLDKLANEPLHLDELARILKLPISSISQNLTVMELKGLVKNVGGSKYQKI